MSSGVLEACAHTVVASLRTRLCPSPCAAPRSKRKAGAVSAPYPPVLFIHMPRDTHVAYLVAKNMEELKAIVRPGKGAGACPLDGFISWSEPPG